MNINTDLINQCKGNDRKAQKELYLKLLPYLRAICMRYLRHKDLVKDVLQDSFIRIFTNLNQFDATKGSFKKWASRTTINITLNYNNRVKFNDQELQINHHDIPLPPSVFSKLSDEEVLKQLKKMPKDLYEVFNLFIIDGYSHKEISELLDISTMLSRKRLSRARDWLKKTKGINVFV